MTITIERSPIIVASFLEQSYWDDEYFRKFIPGTNRRYSNDDDLGHYNYHLGFDLGRRGRDDTLYAVCDGIVEHVDKDSTGAFGLQICLRSKASGYREAAFYAHCQSRTDDGRQVNAGAAIGRMGTTGGVPEHLHFSWLADWTSRSMWRNPGPALRALKAKLIGGGDDDVTDADIEKIAKRVEALLSESDSRLRLDLAARAAEHEKIRNDLAVRAGEHTRLQTDVDKIKTHLGIT